MTPGGLGVHVGSSSGPVFETDLHIVLHFGSGLYFNLRQIFHEHSLFGRFLELHPCLDIFTQQVVNLLVVNFDETATDQMRLARIALGQRHDLTEGSRDDSLVFLAVLHSHHGMGFSASCLAVCKNSAVVALQDVVYKGEGRLLVDQALG